jgi:hypothetical protein
MDTPMNALKTIATGLGILILVVIPDVLFRSYPKKRS